WFVALEEIAKSQPYCSITSEQDCRGAELVLCAKPASGSVVMRVSPPRLTRLHRLLPSTCLPGICRLKISEHIPWMYERRCILVLLDRSRTVRPLRGGTCESAKLRYWLGRKTRGKDRISRGATSFPARSCGRSSASVPSRSGAGGTTRKMAFPPPR